MIARGAGWAAMTLVKVLEDSLSRDRNGKRKRDPPDEPK
ncbi:MAG: glycoside hydrolase family 88 protein [Planctomycetes bacterium]|nr:glycoside hydrolase family 88 protein [Planctomycetota bacterium]